MNEHKSRIESFTSSDLEILTWESKQLRHNKFDWDKSEMFHICGHCMSIYPAWQTICRECMWVRQDLFESSNDPDDENEVAELAWLEKAEMFGIDLSVNPSMEFYGTFLD